MSKPQLPNEHYPMKLQKLTIENIASIEKAEIDFAAEPLVDEPVFLICGPTGSGKSTILDAICLALYNKVPRLDNAPSESYSDGLSEFDTGASKGDVRINDPRMLLRRGAKSCRITLTFTDSLNTGYTASWSCRHARGRISGRVSKVDWELTVSDGTYLCKRADVEARIFSAVGMNFEQFRRTTMLAQGEFSRFLTSDANSKSEILEKLTGTSLYSRIGAEIDLRTRRSREVVETLMTRLDSVEFLTGEQKTAAGERLAALSEESKRMNTECDGVVATVQSLRKVADLRSRLAMAEMERVAAEAESLSEEMTAMRGEVRLFDLTSPLRSLIAQRSSITKSIAAEQSKASVTTRYAEALARFGVLCSTRDAACRNLAGLRGRKEALASLEPVFASAGVIGSKVADHQSAVAEARSAGDILKKAEAHVAEATKKAERLEAEERKARENLSALSRSLEEARRSLATLDPERVSAAVTACSGRVKEFDAASRLIDLYIESRDKLSEARSEEAVARRRHAEAVTGDAAAAAALARARNDKHEADMLYDRQRESVDDYLSEVRSRLSVGERCPLCGQEIAELTSDDKFRSLLEPVRKRRDDCAAKFEEAAEQAGRCAAALRSALTEAGKTAKALAAAEAAFGKASSALLSDALCRDYLDSLSGEIDHVRFAAGRSAATEACDKAMESGRQVATAAGLVSELSGKASAATVSCDKIAAERSEAVGHRTKVSGEAEAAGVRLAEAEARKSRIAEELSGLVAGVLEQSVTEQAALLSAAFSSGRFAEFAAEVERFAGDYTRISAIEAELVRTIESLDGAVSKCSECRCEIEKRRPEWAGVAAAALPREMDKADTLADSVASGFAALLTEVVDAGGRLASLKLQLSEAEDAIARFAASNPEVDIVAAEALAALGNGEIEKRRILIANADNRLLLARQKESGLASDLAAAAVSVPEGCTQADIPALDGRIKSLKEAVAECDKERGAIEQRLRDDEEAHRRHSLTLAELEEKRRHLDRWHRLNQLFGSADGKRMRNIAQSFVLADLAVHANHYLRRLSPRYEIVTQPGRLTLLVRDNDAGGDVRPAANLSGGESFIVSLALALGLPSLGGNATAMDVIFIDEGFGTLDSGSRDLVIDTLERLHSLGGKRVGLISHVEALRERIPVKIEVTRLAPTLSEVKVRDSR